MENRIKKLENDILDLKNRDEPITTRECITSLEEHIMLEILGSKKKMRKFQGTWDLFKDPSHSVDCQNYLINKKISQDHIDLIPLLKKDGNKSAHSKRPSIPRPEMDDLMISVLPDPNDIQDQIMTKELLMLLENYCPAPLVGNWVVTKP